MRIPEAVLKAVQRACTRCEFLSGPQRRQARMCAMRIYLAAFNVVERT